MEQFIFLCVLILTILLQCECYKILLVSPIPGKSHEMLGNGLAKHLVNAGHEVTLITSTPNKKPIKNLTEIFVGDTLDKTSDHMGNVTKIMNKEIDVFNMNLVTSVMRRYSVMTLQHSDIQKLISDPTQHFDVVIAEWMFNELYTALRVIFDCPFIWFSTTEPFWLVLMTIDDPPNPSYNQDILSTNTPPLDFIKRVQELFCQVNGILNYYFKWNPTQKEDYEKIIVPVLKRLGKQIPSFDEVKRNVSLMLGNSHVSLGQTIRLPQNYIPIAGFHIDNNVTPLTKDLKTIMDTAKHGVIYFSMGSNLKSKQMPSEIKKGLLDIFGKLKQTVIWKFEEDLPNRPNNVHIVQWAQQHSILAHPNCVLFITHGGYLSLTETIHFGVPIIGIPVFGDQFSNMVRAVEKGYAKKVDLSYSMVEDLKVAIYDILNDSRYKKRAKELSLVYHDRPVPPGKELVHWVEHVIRTGGAIHLRSPALDVAWYKKMYLDLAAVLLSGLIILEYFLIYIFKYLLKLCSVTISKEKKRN
ncbi:UDP-glucosyltransferase 2-like [Battus philenor]|uniref:UDP-glucosyltransferase 2-like n=1 Tax=Battus philenor TaxID=42288 RepID=UPI0035CEA96B